MFAFWLALVVLYLCLIVVHHSRAHEIARPSWSPIVRTERFLPANLSVCDRHEDCPDDRACFRQRCLPKLQGSGTCDPETGDWVLVRGRSGETPRVACQCRYPHLFGQRQPGGDCDLDVTCGAHGRLTVDPGPGDLPLRVRCACDAGFEAVARSAVGSPTCRQKTAGERALERAEPCGEREVSRNEGPFDPAYLDSPDVRGVACLREPCTFDALTGRPLRHARYVPNWGCVCDPRWGNVGARLNLPAYLRDAPGYDACLSVFREEPENEVRVELYAYFYVFDRAPMAFVRFPEARVRQLKPQLVPKGASGGTVSLQIEESWPHDHMQYVLGNEKIVRRTRNCYNHSLYTLIGEYEENRIREGGLIDCGGLKDLRKSPVIHCTTYDVLYGYPACWAGKNDERFHPHLRGKAVANPLNMSWAFSPKLKRSNGLVLRRDIYDQWLLDYADSDRVRTFIDAFDPESETARRIVPFLPIPVKELAGLDLSFLPGDQS